MRMFGNMMGGASDAAVAKFEKELHLWEVQDRTSLLITLPESPGVLNKALNILTSNKVNMTRIQSKPTKFFFDNWREFDFYIDVQNKSTDTNLQKAIMELKLISNKIQEVGTPEVPWFPTRIEDLDYIGKRTLGEGEGIQEADHPSFRDPEYRKRRDYIAKVAFDYRMGQPIPNIAYTDHEKATWKYCY